MDPTGTAELEVLAKPSVQMCQEGQQYTLENTSYECNHTIGYCIFNWKIPKVHQEKLAEENVLYSPPFYTEQNTGYKLCLFLYMDGDGSGKGTHLSFLALMRGEYDALLTWPFRQTVTLMLLDQDKQQNNIAKWFKPDPVECDANSLSLFQPSPHSEMNVAFSCPKFALLSILENPCYIKNDTMTLRCIVNTAGS